MRTDEHQEIAALEHLEHSVDSQEVARLDETTAVRKYESGNRAIYGAYRDGGESVADRLARVDVRGTRDVGVQVVVATARSGSIGELYRVRLLEAVEQRAEPQAPYEAESPNPLRESLKVDASGSADSDEGTRLTEVADQPRGVGRDESGVLVVDKWHVDNTGENPPRWARAGLVAASVAAAESRGLTAVRFEGDAAGTDQPHLAARREGDAWVLDISDTRAQEEAAEGWKRLAAERASSTFPESGAPEELESRMELLPSGRYEQEVDLLASERARVGERWSPEEVQALKSDGVAGFADPVTGRALVRWDGRPGEVSTVYHEMYHLGQLTPESGGAVERSIPTGVMEGFAELDAQEAAGVWDKIGARTAHDADGQRYEVLMMANDDQWARAQDGRETFAVWSGHRTYDAVRSAVSDGARERIVLRVGGSYPAAVQAARGIRAWVPEAVALDAMRTGDDARLRTEFDRQLGKGAYSDLVETLGDDVRAWQDETRASELRRLLTHRGEKSLRGR